MQRILAGALAALVACWLGIGSAAAQNAYGEVGSGCNAAPSPSLTAGEPVPLPIDPATGALCTRHAPNSVTYPAPTTGSVSTSSATIVATPGAQMTKICNTTAAGGGNIWLNPGGGTAAAQAGDEAQAGGGCIIYSGPVQNSNSDDITGVSDSGTATFTVTLGN